MQSNQLMVLDCLALLLAQGYNYILYMYVYNEL